MRVFGAGFSDLSLNDQMRLLQSTWAEILTLTLAFRSLPMISLGRLKFAIDFTLDEKQSKDCGALELYQTVNFPPHSREKSCEINGFSALTWWSVWKVFRYSKRNTFCSKLWC